MIPTFAIDQWVVVLPRRRTGIFASPYLEPVEIVTRERTRNDLEECFGCGQLREDVVAVVVDADHGSVVEVCGDCRQEHAA